MLEFELDWNVVMLRFDMLLYYKVYLLIVIIIY